MKMEPLRDFLVETLAEFLDQKVFFLQEEFRKTGQLDHLS